MLLPGLVGHIRRHHGRETDHTGGGAAAAGDQQADDGAADEGAAIHALREPAGQAAKAGR